MTPPDKLLQKPPVRANRLRAAFALAAVGLGLIGIAWGYQRFWLGRPIGTGPAGPRLARDAFQKAWTQRPVLLVGLGDSVTAGFAARRGYGYFDRLVANPADEFADMRGIGLSTVFPHLRATNLAVSGSISHELLAQQLPRLPQVGTDELGWVVITTGGNDLIHNYGRTPPREEAMYGATLDQAKQWIEHFEARIETVIAIITNHFPAGCHIFVATIFDFTDGAGDIQRAGLPPWKDGLAVLAAFNQALRRCAERHPQVHVIEIHDAFLGHGIHCTQFWGNHYAPNDPHYWYYENLEDPNERGYDAIRRLVLQEMANPGQRL